MGGKNLASHRKGHESLTSRSVVLGAGCGGYGIRRFSIKREGQTFLIVSAILGSHPSTLHPMSTPVFQLDPYVPVNRRTNLDGQELVPG